MKEEHSGLIKAGIIFFIFSIASSLFNYLYQTLMGRMLGPIEFGVLGSLFAIIYIVTFSTSTFNLIFSKFSAEFHGKNERGKIKYLFQKNLSKILLIGFILFIIYILLTPFIANFLKIEGYFGIIVVGLIAYVSFISVLFTGILNGMQKFIWQNSTGFISTILKFTLAIILVTIGFKVNGALTAVLLGMLLSLFISYIPIKKEIKEKSISFNLKKIYLYAIPVFFASILFILIITMDEILVKHFFSSEQAGIYIAAATIGKIIWFGTGFLIGPLFPKIVSLRTQKKDTSHILRTTLIFVASLAMLGCLILFIAPSFITHILFGSAYQTATPLILYFGIALGLFSLIQILMIYNLAIEKFNFIYILLAGVILEIITITLFHNTLSEVVKILLGTNIFIFAGLLFFNRKEIFQSFDIKKTMWPQA